MNWGSKILETTTIAPTSWTDLLISIPLVPCYALVYEENKFGNNAQCDPSIRSKLFDDSTFTASKQNGGIFFCSGYQIKEVYSIDGNIQRISSGQQPNYNFYTLGFRLV